MTDFPQILNTEIIDTETDIFWGNNVVLTKKTSPIQVLIISAYYTENSAEDTQLNKILGACQLPAEAYTIVQLREKESVAWHYLKHTLQPATVILFGIHPNQLGVSALFRLNNINNFDGVTWIPTLSLQQLEQQPQAKKELWGQALKPIFAEK